MKPVLFLFTSAAAFAQQFQTPEQIVPPLGVVRVMQCQRDPLGALACLPVRFLPSVRFVQVNGLLTVSAPDPARSVWIQAHGINANEYSADIAASPNVKGMPMNYFCIDLAPSLSGSGAAILLFDAAVRLSDDSLIRVTGQFASGPALITDFSSAVGWPGTYGGSKAPPGTVHLYPIGPGCRNFPAISFEPLFSENSLFTIEDVFVFVSIP